MIRTDARTALWAADTASDRSPEVRVPSANPASTTDPGLRGLTLYETRHLVHHLAQAGRILELHALLALESSSGRNAWYGIKSASHDIEGYARDIAFAWTEADRLAIGDPTPPTIRLQCRYAVISASLRSMAAARRPLLPLAATHGVVPMDWASATALLLPDPEARVLTLIDLASVASAPQKKSIHADALTVARAVPDPSQRARLLGALVPSAQDVDRPILIQEAQEALWKVPPNASRLRPLAALLPHLSPALRLSVACRALREAEGCSPDHYAYLAEAVAGYLSPTLLTQLHESLTRLADTGGKDLLRPLATLVRYLPPEEQDALNETLRNKALAEWGGMQEADTLASLAAVAPQEKRLRLLQDAFTKADFIEVGIVRSAALARVALPMAELGYGTLAVKAVSRMGDEKSRAEAMCSIVPFLDTACLTKIARMRTGLSSPSRVRVLTALMGHVSDAVSTKYATEALRHIPQIRHPEERAEALAAIIRLQGTDERSVRTASSLAAADLIGDIEVVDATLKTLDPANKKGMVFTRGEHNREPKTVGPKRRKRLAVRGRVLSRDDGLREIQRISQMPWNEYGRAVALAELAPSLPETLYDDVLRTVLNYKYGSAGLEKLVPLLQDEQLQTVVELMTRSEAGDDSMVGIMKAVVPWLHGDMVCHAFEAAMTYGDDRTSLHSTSRGEFAVRGAERLEILCCLAGYFARVNRTPLYRSWTKSLHAMASRVRSSLLTDWSELRPVITSLGGDKTLVEACGAIKEVTRWFP